MAKIIRESEFKSEVLEAQTPVLVDFYADWCGPCKMMAPVLDQLSGEHGEKFKIVKVNVDDDPSLAQAYGVMSIPNMVIFKNGEVADRVIGAVPAAMLKSKIEGALE